MYETRYTLQICGATVRNTAGVKKGVFFFWKEEWLDRVAPQECDTTTPLKGIQEQYPYQYKFSDGRYVCQSTELVRATYRLPAWDLAMFYRDIKSRTFSVKGLAKALSYAMYLRVRYLFTGESYRYVKGFQKKTPKESLNLQSGEWVKVKTREEIVATLDSEGKNRGLIFTVEMQPFCGKTYRVLRRLEKMIYEPTGKLINVDDTVILENVICDGSHILRGGCPRENFHYWREIWLQRVPLERTIGPRDGSRFRVTSS